MDIKRKIASLRFYNSGLIKRNSSSHLCAKQLIGVQAQILSSAGLAIFNRLETYNIDQFKRDLFKDKNLIKLWGQRTTLHLFSKSDWPTICSANFTQKSWWSKKVEKKYNNHSKYLELIEQVENYAKDKGEFSRQMIKEKFNLDNTLLSSWGGIFIDLVAQGIICHTENRNKHSYFAHREYWLDDLIWETKTEEEAKLEILYRYLQNYAPATLNDFAYWAGITLTEAKSLFKKINEYFDEIVIDNEKFQMPISQKSIFNEIANYNEIVVLGRFDPILLAYKDKSWLIDNENYKKVWRVAGHIEASIIKDFNIIGTWTYKMKADSITYKIKPFYNLTSVDIKQIKNKLELVTFFFLKKNSSFEFDKGYHS